MARIGIPFQDAQFRSWADNFAMKAGENESELGLTPEQVADLLDAAADYYTAYQENQRLKSAYQGSTATKREARSRIESLTRSIGKVILVDESISLDLKAELGMHVVKAPVSQVQPPTQLAACPQAEGVNCMKWSRNGNSVHTVFIIEARTGDSSVWSYVGATTKLKFNHLNQIPGQMMSYRVHSQRGDQASPPSNQATVYSPKVVRTISLPKAA